MIGRSRIYFFFFSSRRRHTRLQGDWSSDVCSSDLPLFAQAIMKDYQPDNAKTPFRSGILQARDVLKKHAKAFPEEFHGDLNALKKRVAAEQKNLALATLELEDGLKKLQD